MEATTGINDGLVGDFVPYATNDIRFGAKGTTIWRINVHRSILGAVLHVRKAHDRKVRTDENNLDTRWLIGHRVPQHVQQFVGSSMGERLGCVSIGEEHGYKTWGEFVSTVTNSPFVRNVVKLSRRPEQLAFGFEVVVPNPRVEKFKSFSPASTPPVPDTLEDGLYIGDGDDGVYVAWTVSPNGRYVRFSSTVDSDTGGFCESYGEDEVVKRAKAQNEAEGRIWHASSWCAENNVEYDDADFQRALAEASKI